MMLMMITIMIMIMISITITITIMILHLSTGLELCVSNVFDVTVSRVSSPFSNHGDTFDVTVSIGQSRCMNT